MGRSTTVGRRVRDGESKRTRKAELDETAAVRNASGVEPA